MRASSVSAPGAVGGAAAWIGAGRMKAAIKASRIVSLFMAIPPDSHWVAYAFAQGYLKSREKIGERMTGPAPYEIEPGEGDPRRVAPHVARNAEPIAAVLADILPARGLVLELASGSGEHCLHFARVFPKLLFQPSDPEPAALRSIEAWRQGAGLFNLLPPVALDARAADWEIAEADAILCINMIHVSPWPATAGLMRGAGKLLAPGAPLYLYGAYRRTGVETAPSNEAFDENLRARDPDWGLRQLDDVVAEAERHGLVLDKVVPMPANNLSVIFRKA